MPDQDSTEQTGNRVSRTSIYRHMVHGAFWAVAGNWMLRGIGLINTVILARILAPEDFGLVAMAALLTGLLDTFFDLGTGSLLIRQREATREHCDTAWTIGILRGAAVAVLLILLAPLAAKYFSEQRVTNLCYVVALSSAISGAANIGMVLVRKELDFFRDFRFTVYMRLLTFFATMALAFTLQNYWALVLGQLVGSLFYVWLSFQMHPYRPRLSLAKARAYVNFSLTIVPLNIIFYLNQRADVFVVGRVASTPMLGIYHVAADLSSMFTHGLMMQVSRALYPSYATLIHDLPKLRAAYLNSVSALCILSIALGLGLFAVSKDFVIVVLGDQWRSAVPFVQWLALGGVAKALGVNIAGGILILTGREKLVAATSFVRLVIFVAAVFLGAQIGGVQGVAIAATIVPAGMVPIVAYFVMMALSIRFKDFIGSLWRPVVGGVIMVVAVRFLHLKNFSSPPTTLAIDVVTGALFFFSALVGLWWLSGRPDGAERKILHSVGLWVKQKL